jgi:hypothetical protein
MLPPDAEAFVRFYPDATQDLCSGSTPSGSSGKFCGLGQERDAGLAAGAMTAPLSPGEGTAVRIPVVGRLRDGGDDLVPGLEAASGPGKRAQHLPPWLDEVEVGGAFRLEHHLPARMRQQEEQHVGSTSAARWLLRLAAMA